MLHYFSHDQPFMKGQKMLCNFMFNNFTSADIRNALLCTLLDLISKMAIQKKRHFVGEIKCSGKINYYYNIMGGNAPSIVK